MSGPRTYPDLLGDAVAVLTEAARRTATWTERGGHEHQRRADFAEFVTLAVAGAAANLGGIEEVLAGRPGSWEADHVRQMLQSTVGHDEAYLAEHRTEPLVITVAVDNLLNDLGLWQLYEQADDELDQLENTVWAAVDDARPVGTDGVETDPMQDLSSDQEATLDELDRLRAALEAQRQRDWQTYGEAFTTNALRAVAELLPGLPVPVQLDVQLDWQPDQDAAIPPWGPAYTVWERARDLTPLPGTGIPLRDYPFDPCLPEIERAAGRDPLTRLLRHEQAHADALLCGPDERSTDERGGDRA